MMAPGGRLRAYLESRWRWARGPLVLSLSLTAIVTTIVSFLGGLRNEGHDFYAYLDGARRLIETGSPYLPSLLSEELLTTEMGQYLYPPLLAQLLIPAALLPVDAKLAIFLVYTALSLTVLAVSLAWSWRRAGGRIEIIGACIGAALCCLYLPNVAALGTGNVGFLLAGLVTLAVAGHALPAALIGGAVKLLPGVLLLAERRRAITGALTGSLLALALSIVLSPGAWGIYLTDALVATTRSGDQIGLGGNPAAIARFSGTVAELRGETGMTLRRSLETNYDGAILDRVDAVWWAWTLPTELLTGLSSLEVPLRGASLLLGLLLILAGARLASDRARRHAAVAYLIAGSLFIPWTLWDHYLVVLLSPALIAWRIGDRPARLRLALGFLAGTTIGWWAIGAYLMIPVSLFLLLDGIRRTRLPEPAEPR